MAPQTPQPPAAPLVVNNLSAGYGGARVLQHISFQVAPQQICAVLGTSGCGKSTLLRHAVGLLRPSAGSVTLLGEPLHALGEAARARLMQRVGLLFQGGALLHSLSVLDNVALPLRAAAAHVPRDLAHDVARLKLEMVGLGHAAHAMPSTLSGGMRKRAALARALALDPEILFCDEPSAGLDPVMAAELDQLILDLRARLNMTVVLVTHELASIEAIADRVLMLHAGALVADGSVAAMRAHPHEAARSFFARAARPKAARAPNLWDTLNATAPRNE